MERQHAVGIQAVKMTAFHTSPRFIEKIPPIHLWPILLSWIVIVQSGESAAQDPV